MTRQRIHQLAAEWGVESREIVERLEKMGIRGKRAQSVLTDSEAKRVREEMGLGDNQQRLVVTRTTIERSGDGAPSETVITETRVKPGVVLRRTKRAEGAGSPRRAPLIIPADLRAQAPTSVELAPDILCSFDVGEFADAAAGVVARGVIPVIIEPETEPEATPAPVEVIEEAPLNGHAQPVTAEPVEVAETEEVQPAADEEDEEEKVPVDEPQKRAIEEELLSHAEARKAEEEGTGPRRGAARVLGRIDLTRKQQPVLPQQATTPAAAPAKPEEEKPGRKKKRKVVRKEDMFDAFERSFQARPRKRRAAPGQKVRKTELTVPKASKRVVRINEVTSPGELAKSMGVKAGEVLGALMRLGVMKSINDPIDFETSTLVADEFNYTVENTAVSVEELLQGVEPEGVESDMTTRPPVVTVMGHVDHGKTSLLDAIRSTNVVASESGGITQHIGAYMVPTSHGEVCFLDTPGHAAFTAMRARGASVTDIVVLVVAADDGVMPQTIEAINHARAANLPVIVAVNKIDKPGANPDRIKQQLSEHGLQPEEWGGQTQFVEVSALKRVGIDGLLEAISLLAQILELKAPVDRPAHGIVIESRLDKGRGPVATILVQQGTLKLGDFFVCGESTGRVRAMIDHTGAPIREAGPSQPVEILGLDAVPLAGDTFDAVEDSGRAAQVAEHRRDTTRKAQQASSVKMSLEDLQRQVASGAVNDLKVIIKADVHGSAEALKGALEKLGTSEVTLTVIHTGVGAITESDVQLALASNAIVIGFHVRPEGKARTLAEREGVDIRLHTIIYEAIEEVRAALEGLLAPDYKEVVEGRAEVRQTFTVPGGVTIAGSYVTDGKVTRNSRCRLLRDNVVVHEGKIGSLRRFKDDVREVQSGYECGIGIDRFNDLKPGDVVECFRMEEIKRTLADRPSSSPSSSASA